MNNKELSQPEKIHVYRKNPEFFGEFSENVHLYRKRPAFLGDKQLYYIQMVLKKPVQNIDWYFSTLVSMLLHVSQKKKRKNQDAIILKKDNFKSNLWSKKVKNS